VSSSGGNLSLNIALSASPNNEGDQFEATLKVMYSQNHYSKALAKEKTL